MSKYITEEIITKIKGSTWKPRLTIRDKNTRIAKDMSGYSCKWAVKASPDETSIYVVEPVTGTTDSSGHLDATILPEITSAIEPGEYIAEWFWTIGSDSSLIEKRGQYKIEVVGRVTV